MAVAEEGAAEGALTSVTWYYAALIRNGDVGSQFHELAAEGFSVFDVGGERHPFVFIADDVRISLRACAWGCGNIVCATKEDTVIVCLHHAVVLH